MAAVAASMLVSNAFAQKIKGSDTCLPLSQTEAENFINKNKSAKITVTGGGSGVGISALMEGTTDIAMSSRKMKFDEKVKLQEAKKSAKEVVIAYDALAVVVHPSNQVSNLTREQLEGIFTGKIKNWKEVGGAEQRSKTDPCLLRCRQDIHRTILRECEKQGIPDRPSAILLLRCKEGRQSETFYRLYPVGRRAGNG